MNGMAIHGGVRPFGGTFLIFSDYMRGSIRLAALMKAPVVYVFTHDSVGLGEDGPTHEPIEHLASLRAMPGLIVIRPADATETAEAWRTALSLTKGRPVGDLPETGDASPGGETAASEDLPDISRSGATPSEGMDSEVAEGPVALCLTRQNLPVLDRTRLAPASGVAKGGYVLSDPEGRLDLILLASGSEVSLALEAAEQLAGEGTNARVVSMPSWELFERQPEEYRNEVIPPNIPARLSIEAAATFGWERWIGDHGHAIGIDHFGASAPGGKILSEFGFNPENVVKVARRVVERCRSLQGS